MNRIALVTITLCFIVSNFGCSSIRRRSNGEDPNQPAETAVEETKEQKDPTQAKIDSLTATLAKSQARIEELEARMAAMNDSLEGTKIAIENISGPNSKNLKQEPIGELSDKVAETKPTLIKETAQKRTATKHPVVAATALAPEAAQAETDERASEHVESKVDPAAIAEFTQAMNLYRKGNYADAVLALNKFVSGHKEHILASSALYHVGECYFQMGEYKLAQPEYQGVLGRYPNSPRAASAAVRLSQVYEVLGNHAEAEKIKQFAQTQYEGNPSLDLRAPASGKANKTSSQPTTTTEPAASVEKNKDQLTPTPMEMNEHENSH